MPALVCLRHLWWMSSGTYGSILSTPAATLPIGAIQAVLLNLVRTLFVHRTFARAGLDCWLCLRVAS